jgi:hypothetical protein
MLMLSVPPQDTVNNIAQVLGHFVSSGRKNGLVFIFGTDLRSEVKMTIAIQQGVASE